MQLTIAEMFEVGLHCAPVHPESPLFYIFWIALLWGAGVQLLLHKKTKRPFARWSFILFHAICVLACDIACQVIIGWDRLSFLIFYWIFLTILIGAVLCTLVFFFVKKKRAKQ